MLLRVLCVCDSCLGTVIRMSLKFPENNLGGVSLFGNSIWCMFLHYTNKHYHIDKCAFRQFSCPSHHYITFDYVFFFLIKLIFLYEIVTIILIIHVLAAPRRSSVKYGEIQSGRQWTEVCTLGQNTDETETMINQFFFPPLCISYRFIQIKHTLFVKITDVCEPHVHRSCTGHACISDVSKYSISKKFGHTFLFRGVSLFLWLYYSKI